MHHTKLAARDAAPWAGMWSVAAGIDAVAAVQATSPLPLAVKEGGYQSAAVLEASLVLLHVFGCIVQSPFEHHH
jgi:hypothetical protein